MRGRFVPGIFTAVGDEASLMESNEEGLWLSVVVPVHNEGDQIAQTLRELNAVLVSQAPKRCEIIVVDDGSTDLALSRCCEIDSLRIIRLSSRGGSGAARKRGVAASRGCIIAWVDGDGTYDPESLLALVQIVESTDVDQVIGARSTDYGKLRWLRIGTKWAACAIASVLWHRYIPDINSGLRVFRRDSLLKWADRVPQGFSCTTTATLEALNHGQKLVFISVPYRPRRANTPSKFHPLFDTFRLLRTIFKLRTQPFSSADSTSE